jgi:hypothetical protein
MLPKMMWRKFAVDLSIGGLLAFVIPFTWILFALYLSFVLGLDLKAFTPKSPSDAVFRSFVGVLPWTLTTFPVVFFVPAFFWEKGKIGVVMGILSVVEFVAFFLFLRITGAVFVSGAIYVLSLLTAFIVLRYSRSLLDREDLSSSP